MSSDNNSEVIEPTEYILQSPFKHNFWIHNELVKYAILNACREGLIRDHRNVQAGPTGAYIQDEEGRGCNEGIIIRCTEEEDYLRLWEEGVHTGEGHVTLFGKLTTRQKVQTVYRCIVSGMPLSATEVDVIRILQRSMAATNEPVPCEIQEVVRETLEIAEGASPIPTNKWFVVVKTKEPGKLIRKGNFQPKIVDAEGYHVRFWFDCLTKRAQKKEAPPPVPPEERQFDAMGNFRGFHPQQQHEQNIQVQQTQAQQTQVQQTQVQQPQVQQPQVQQPQVQQSQVQQPQQQTQVQQQQQQTQTQQTQQTIETQDQTPQETQEQIQVKTLSPLSNEEQDDSVTR